MRAHTALLSADALAPDDPKTLYFLGLTEEALERPQEALELFARYVEVPESSSYRRLMAARHTWILRQLIRDELVALVAAEDSLTAEGVTEAIAVFPLSFMGGDSLYRPLGRGLSEMLTVDLAQVPGLQVVERVRLHTLLDELALAQGDAFDPTTAPRLGRLLRSGRVVGGSFAVMGEDLRVDVALWEWPTEPLPNLSAHLDKLDQLFQLEKEIVFALLDGLGIPLTLAQREQIERVPTRNLQAFLAYSRGLREEDAGNFAGAAGHYSQAAGLDPGFSEAAQKAAETQALAEVAGPVEVALAAPGRTQASQSLGGSLVGRRLTLLNETIGAHVVPGEEAREPTAEIPLTPPGVPIPDPPPPPGGGN